MAIVPPQPGIQIVRGLYPEVGTTGALVGQTDILQSGAAATNANNPQFTGQVTLEEIHHDDMEIEEHPIEQGAPIIDHTFKKSAELTLRIGWAGSQLPSTSAQQAFGPPATFQAQLNAIYTQLLQGQSSRVMYTVVTGKRQYQQMMIKSIDAETDYKKENVLEVVLHMRQMLLATTQVVAVSAPQNAQAQPQATNPTQQTGRASLQNAPNFNESSAVLFLPMKNVLLP